jgi:hypothetical protein
MEFVYQMSMADDYQGATFTIQCTMKPCHINHFQHRTQRHCLPQFRLSRTRQHSLIIYMVDQLTSRRSESVTRMGILSHLGLCCSRQFHRFLRWRWIPRIGEYCHFLVPSRKAAALCRHRGSATITGLQITFAKKLA